MLICYLIWQYILRHFEQVRQWFDFWHGIYDETPGSNRTDIVFPVESELTDEKRAYIQKRIHDMDVGSEAVFVAGQAMFDLLKHFDVNPDVMVGHSSGENSALVASRALPWGSRSELAQLVRKLNGIYNIIEKDGGIERGQLMAVALISKDKIEQFIKDTKIVVAMENCPTQTIIYGSKEDVEELSKKLVKEGAVCEMLPFDRGYHTDAFAPMKEGFIQYYNEVGLQEPEIPLYSCASASLFPEKQGDIQEIAAAQWTQKVRFIETIEKMHEDGVRYFIEVGPSSKLASFAEQILRGKEGEIIISSSNLNSKSGLYQFLTLLAKLYVNDKVKLENLFADREVKLLDFEKLEKEKPKGMFLDNSLPRLRATDELADALKKITPALASISQEQQPAQVNNICAVAHDDYSDYRPFFTQISELTTDSFVGNSYLSIYEDNFLQDHVISGAVSDIDPELMGLACVPLMASLEIMAEACAVVAGSIDLRVIADVKTFNWIMLDDGEVNLEVSASRLSGKNNGFYAEIFNNGQKVVCAEYWFGEQELQLVESLPDIENSSEPYKWPEDYEEYSVGMFHGPIFQTIKNIERWNNDGLDAKLSPVSLEHFFRNGEVPSTVINPVLMDSLNQSAVFWVANDVGPNFQSFPTKIERIEFFTECPENIDGLKNKARRQQSLSGKDDGIWNIECVDADNNPIIRVKNLQNVFFEIPYNVYECRTNPLTGWLGNPINDNGSDLQWHLSYVDKELLAKSDSVLLRLIANCYLNENERQIWQQIKHYNIADKVNWLFPRICMKEAVRYQINNQTGELLYPTDIEIITDEEGNFYADGWWCSDEYFLVEAPSILIEFGSDECFVSLQMDELQDEFERYGS
jgi:malonyl CoA-acyl carrier protein transacylase